MSDEMGDKFKQIADMLGQNSNTNIPDNVKGLLNMLMTNSSTKEEGSPEDTSQKPSTNGDPQKVESDEVNDMTRKMKKAMTMLNPPNDPKVNLLNALRPYLNENRQKKTPNVYEAYKNG